MFYFISILFITLLGCLGNHNQQQKVVFFVCLLMFLLVGLRAEFVGTDTPSYLLYAISNETGTRFGIIFETLSEISKKLSDSPQTFLLTSALVTFIPLSIIINKLSTRPCVSLLIYIIATAGFFLETFNIVRQAAAIIYMIIAIWNWTQGKKNKFIIIAIVAFFLHPVSIIVIPILYIQKRWYPSFAQVCSIIVITAVIGFSGLIDILNYALNLISPLLKSTDFIMFSNYSDYFENDITSKLNTIGILMHILPISITCIVTYVKGYSQNDIWYKLMLVGCILVNLLVSTSYVERFASNFTIMQIFVVAKSLSITKAKQKTYIKAWIACSILIFIHTLISMNSRPNAGNPLPYDFFFNYI